MPLAQSRSFATLLVGSAAFFVATTIQMFVFHSAPLVGDWVQILIVPVIAMALYRVFGRRLDTYVQEVVNRKSRALLGLFVLNCLLFFIPVCLIIFFS